MTLKKTLSLVEDITHLIDNTIQIIINNNYINTNDVGDVNVNSPLPSVREADANATDTSLSLAHVARANDLTFCLPNTDRSHGRDVISANVTILSGTRNRDGCNELVPTNEDNIKCAAGDIQCASEVNIDHGAVNTGHRLNVQCITEFNVDRGNVIDEHRCNILHNDVGDNCDIEVTDLSHQESDDYKTTPINSDISNNSRDSVHTLENISKQSSREGVKTLEDAIDDTKVVVEDSNCDDRYRTLFYRFHDPNMLYYRDSDYPINYRYQMIPGYCTSPSELGFDSVESFNNSLNSKCEVIIKPPIGIGRSISFRSHVGKSLINPDEYIANTIFQLDWTNKRRKKTWTCCEV